MGKSPESSDIILSLDRSSMDMESVDSFIDSVMSDEMPREIIHLGNDEPSNSELRRATGELDLDRISEFGHMIIAASGILRSAYDNGQNSFISRYFGS